MRCLLALLIAVAVGSVSAAEGDAAGEPASGGTEQAQEGGEQTAPEPALPRRIADFTQSAAEGVIDRFERAWAVVTAMGESELTVDWSALGASLMRLGIVAVATFLAFMLLRWAARGLFARADRWALAGERSYAVVRRVLAVIAAVTVDALVVVLAWVGGYAIALFGLGVAGSMAMEQSLFLNAFLAIELFKVVIRMLFAARDDGLRLLPLAAADAAYWNARLAVLAGFLGYGLLLFTPLVTDVARAVGTLLAPLIKVIGFIYAAVIITRNRAIVRDKLLKRSRQLAGASGILVAIAARSWHAVAIVYLASLMLSSMIQPEQSLAFMMTATLQTVLAIGAGVFVSVLLGQLMQRPLRLPETTRTKLPMLEQRLNGFVPRGLQIVRIVIGIVVAAVVIDAWRFIFDLSDWVASPAGRTVIGAVLSVAFIVVLATGVWLGFASWIEHRLNPNAGRGEPGARAKTLLSLFRNAGTIAIVTFTVMISLSEVGVDIGPLLAGAGVLGLAIGFGAQKLVQDIITGVFIQLENAINAGDFITVAGISGTVERLSIRSVGLRDLSGTFHLVPFSAVDTVSNYMREFGYHLGVYGVSYREDVDNVVTHLNAAFDELAEDPEIKPKLLGGVEVDGVTEFADSAVRIRVRIRTTPGDQWLVGRAYNRIVKRRFDEAGIEIPFPHRTVFFREGDGRPGIPRDSGADSGAGAQPAPESSAPES
jgi:small conductance mechanosensitive channel